MKRYACILFPADTPYYHLDLPKYKSYSEALSRFLEEAGDFEQIIGLSLDPGEKNNTSEESSLLVKLGQIRAVEKIILEESTWKGVFQGLWRFFSSQGSSKTPDRDELWFFWGDSPFLNPKIARDIQELFQTYRADYAFADGYPKGIGVEILGYHRLLSMVQLSQIHHIPLGRAGLFELIQKDINSFHIETRMAEGDHRLTRLELHGQYRRTHELVRARAGDFFRARHTDPWDDKTFELPFSEKRFSHRSLPAAINLQIAARCPYSCNYCPYPVVHPTHTEDSRFMELETLKALVRKLTLFMPEGTISLSGFGEPALHPQIIQVLEYLDKESPYTVTVETTGVGWPRGFLEYLDNDPPKRTRFVIGLDTNNSERYSSLGKTGFSEAQAFAHGMVERLKDQVFIQALRLSGGEEDLLSFYQDWEKRTSQVIIQKFDTFSGILPDRKVVDLQPVVRFPCWHLKRELTIQLDGRVVRCKEDLRGEDSLGNAFTDSLEEIWAAYDPIYDQHREGTYPGICRNCDEYYTFSY